MICESYRFLYYLLKLYSKLLIKAQKLLWKHECSKTHMDECKQQNNNLQWNVIICYSLMLEKWSNLLKYLLRINIKSLIMNHTIAYYT